LIYTSIKIEYYEAINKYLKKDDWYVWVSMTSGTPTMPIFQSLEAFWPGLLVGYYLETIIHLIFNQFSFNFYSITNFFIHLSTSSQTLIGELDQAKKSLYNYHQVWKQFGFVPEFYDIPNAKLNNKRDGYPLRPEFIESVFYLYRATRDPHLLQIGADVVEAIYSSTRTECGFATVKSVYDPTIEDRMESFFLAETLKYLYLLFDETNFVNNDGSKGVIIDRKGSHCVVDSGGYVFNTEAHLIDIAAVYCCSHQKNFEDNILSEFQNNLDLYSLFGLHSKSKSSDLLQGIRAKYSSQISNELDIRK
jgi:mannosidase alpha-like ER degradation enhancer 2